MKEMQRTHRWLRWLLAALIIPPLLVVVFTLACNGWVLWETRSHVYSSIDELPPTAVGVVLGTSKNIAPNRPNLHFQTRMEATCRLYEAGRIRHIIVSGAQNSRYYDEPSDMMSALVRLGVPAAAITPDRSGFRTLDSVVRVAEVFGETRYTLITDDFHINRAVFLARHHGHDAIGFAAARVDPSLSFKSRFREVFARVKAVLDVYLFGTQPRERSRPRQLTSHPADAPPPPAHGK
jgi:SanA protein